MEGEQNHWLAVNFDGRDMSALTGYQSQREGIHDLPLAKRPSKSLSKTSKFPFVNNSLKTQIILTRSSRFKVYHQKNLNVPEKENYPN